IVHGLDAAGVTAERGIIGKGASAGIVAEKTGGDVFDGIQTEAVALGGVKRPHSGASEIGLDILGNRLAIGAIESMPTSANRGRVRIHVIIGFAGMTDEGGLGSGAGE